ncbi:hypothetical protein ACOME3_006546 [Neoechinorhynchus agilis]
MSPFAGCGKSIKRMLNNALGLERSDATIKAESIQSAELGKADTNADEDELDVVPLDGQISIWEGLSGHFNGISEQESKLSLISESEEHHESVREEDTVLVESPMVIVGCGAPKISDGSLSKGGLGDIIGRENDIDFVTSRYLMALRRDRLPVTLYRAIQNWKESKRDGIGLF